MCAQIIVWLSIPSSVFADVFHWTAAWSVCVCRKGKMNGPVGLEACGFLWSLCVQLVNLLCPDHRKIHTNAQIIHIAHKCARGQTQG